MHIAKATEQYESWLATYTTTVQKDLDAQARRDGQEPLRLPARHLLPLGAALAEDAPGSAAAPPVLAVGDLHVENFGTWRDSEGRLIWGVNDFDEASTIAYTNDLVRLAASAYLACQEGQLRVGHLTTSARQVLEGLCHAPGAEG